MKKSTPWWILLAIVAALAALYCFLWLVSNFFLYFYPNMQVQRAVSKTDYIFVSIVDQESSTPSLPFKLEGTRAKDFLSQLVSQSGIDSSRVSFTEMLHVELYDKNAKQLLNFKFRPNTEQNSEDWGNTFSNYVEMIEQWGTPSDGGVGSTKNPSSDIELSPAIKLQ